jgi:fatty-acyl-CoA synthase
VQFVLTGEGRSTIPETVPELLTELAAGNRGRLVVYDRRGRRVEEVAYSALARRAFATARAYLDAGFEPGDHVFLQLPHSTLLIEQFLGCIAAGLRPCCVAPPRALGGIEVFCRRMEHFRRHVPRFHLVMTIEAGSQLPLDSNAPPIPSSPAELPLRSVHPDATAFLQLTSGSTGMPRAVSISHRALLTNCTNALAAMRGDSNADCFVSWLPFHHDMGLVGSVFCPLMLPCDLHTLPPAAFLARPEAWLRVISEVRELVVSNAPNFAYRFCVQRIDADVTADLDLSRWRIAGCGGERVRAETLDAFAAHFAAAGFRKEHFVPCYGLAEATLAVTYGDGGRTPHVDSGQISCGRPLPGTEIAIRDAGGRVLPEGAEGEITVRSASLCSGYLASAEPVAIRDGWLCTGDRGYLRDGEIFVSGRYKDLIIIDGVNIDCSEIEGIGDDVTEEAGARSGAFALERDGQECVVLVTETDGQPAEVLAARSAKIREQVARAFGVHLMDLVFVRRGSIHKTSSGKIRRGELRRAYTGNTLAVVWRPLLAKGAP